jgi:hypothetical protein
MELLEYAPDKAIIREGEPGDAFFILRNGSARAELKRRLCSKKKMVDSWAIWE